MKQSPKIKLTDFEGRLGLVRSHLSLALKDLDKLEVTKTEGVTYVCKDGTASLKAMVSEGEVVKLEKLRPIIHRLNNILNI